MSTPKLSREKIKRLIRLSSPNKIGEEQANFLAAMEEIASVVEGGGIGAGGEIVKPTGNATALDIRANDPQGQLLRLFTDGLDKDENPTAMFNAGAHFHSIASVLVSGVPNGLDGEAWDVVEPAQGRYSYMLGVWADTAGPAAIFRSNEYAGQDQVHAEAHPAMFMSGKGAVTCCVEDDGSLSFGTGQLRSDMDVRFGRIAPGLLGVDDRADFLGDNTANAGLAAKTFSCTVGGGLEIEEGANARMGTATLVGGTATVATDQVTGTSRIFLTSQVDGGTPGFLRVSARSAGTSFTITSSSGSDTSTVAWQIIEPFTMPELNLGDELVFNGTFDDNITGWSEYPTLGPSTMEWVDGELHVANATTATRGLFGLTPGTRKFPVESGKSYRVRGTIRCESGKTCSISVVRAEYNAPVFLMIDNNQNPGTYNFDEVLVSDWTGDVHIQGDFQNLVGDCYIDNVSVKEVLE